MSATSHEGASQANTPVDEDEIRRIEHDCLQVLVRFYRCLDARDYAAAAELVAEDGVWHRQGKALHGRQRIVEALEEREPGLVSAHLVLNALVDPRGADAAHVSAYVLVLRQTGEEPITGPLPMPVPRVLLRSEDRFVRTASGWRIAEKRSTPLLRHDAPG